MRELYTYEKSRELFARAQKIIPSGIYGHQGPAEGCYMPVEAFPFYSERALGSRFWDVDGNEFLDYMCGYGPNVLGYNDPDVNAAADAQRAKSDCVTAPSPVMVDFADLLVDTVASADWAFFAKNGNDVTTLAVLTARAHTRRKKIVFFRGYYHGVSPWTQKIDYPGILPEEVANNVCLPWNDFQAIEDLFAREGDEVAAVIAQPYMHGNFADNELPAEGFWAHVRALCDKHGAVLIVDDVRAGFRLDLAGSDHYYGFRADLICFCKALANGYNVSALCGRRELMNTVSGISFTGSYWMSAVPFAAGIACIEKMKRLDLCALLRARGEALKTGLIAAGKKYGFDLHVSGELALPYLRIADDPTLSLHQEWIAECVRRGIFFTNHHNHFLNASLTEEDIRQTIDVADEAFAAVRARREA
ncbi:MAG: aminotransferase class III-fold pyridoxal phosphate-dependent enzyme [Oscillospiraceae bacterium]|jgi:glutamate-1-semialdehyde 2,1-aminomutase|nr:aminotransferase class III-fold pyridoxal phosphate-dependent enzyme [Oscillospiraceae bacterium]